MGFRVEEVREASLTSEVFVACLFQHSCRGWLGLVHQPLVREFASFESRSPRTGLKDQGCVSGSETVCPQPQFAATPRILNFSWPVHTARTQTRHVAESLVYSISCLLHLVHIAAEKSFGRGEKGGEGEKGSKGRFWRKTARCTGLECGARLEFHAGLGVARQGGSLQRWSAKGQTP